MTLVPPRHLFDIEILFDIREFCGKLKVASGEKTPGESLYGREPVPRCPFISMPFCGVNAMPLSLQDLLDRARNAIERREDCVYDIAHEQGQIVANVEHMTWFITLVAVWFTQNVKRWSHLEVLQ